MNLFHGKRNQGNLLGKKKLLEISLLIAVNVKVAEGVKEKLYLNQFSISGLKCQHFYTLCFCSEYTIALEYYQILIQE